MHLFNVNCLWKYLAAFFAVFCMSAWLQAQITPSNDAYIDTTKPTTNYGSAVTLGVVGPSQTTYIAFDLSSIPSSYTASNVVKASLKLYVNTVTTAGSFNVDYINGLWTEKTVTGGQYPALGTTIAASIPIAKTQAHDYLIVDITPAVLAWLNGTQANDGIALVANSSLSVTFDSKENTAQSHPPELDIVFTSGGTITGVQTNSGSGLTGGAMTGTLSLSLLTSCAANQVLQWNGSAWACAGTGSGTVTSVGSGVGLTGGPITTSGALSIAAGGVTNTMLQNPSLAVSAGTGLTGGGAVQLGGAATLSVDPTKVPLLSASNTFTANQTVNGNLSASGYISAGGQVGGSSGGFGGSSNNPILSVSNSGTGDGIDSFASGIHGVYGQSSSTTNFSAGVAGAAYVGSETVGVSGTNFTNGGGAGVYGVANGQSSTGSGLIGGAGVWGDGGNNGKIGVLATADSGLAVNAENNSTALNTVSAYNYTTAQNAPVFYAGGQYGYCSFNTNGSFHCTGTKSAVVPVDAGKREVSLYALEAAENWFEDVGSGQLLGGSASVRLEPTFAQTVNTTIEYHVFLTPKGDCEGLYVTNETPTGFEVHELRGGRSNVAFDYRILAHRKGYESIRLADETATFQQMEKTRLGKEAAKQADTQ